MIVQRSAESSYAQLKSTRQKARRIEIRADGGSRKKAKFRAGEAPQGHVRCQTAQGRCVSERSHPAAQERVLAQAPRFGEYPAFQEL